MSDGDTISSTDKLLNATAQFGKQSGARIGSDHGRLRPDPPGGERRVTRTALVVAAVALAGAQAAQAEKLTIAVTSVSVSAKPTDLPPKGTSKGDTIVLRDRLLNGKAQFGKADGAVVGSDHGTMTFTGPHTARFSGVAVLPGGTLRLNGSVVPVANGLVIPVTGGTGRFAKAKGFVVVGHGDKRAPNTYVLTLPTIPVA